MTLKSISGVILAGGSATRLGGIIKSKIMVAGETILSRMIRVMEEVFDEIIIVTNTPREFENFRHYKIVSDIFLKKGPLGGIHAAIENSSKDAVFVFAGDMPYINRKIIEDQIKKYNEEGSDALVPMIDNYIEPLHAIYSVTVQTQLTEYLKDSDFAVRHFLKNLNTSYMQMVNNEETRLAFRNINTPGDLL